MRLTHVRLLVSDMSAAYRFYKDTLGLTTTWDENPGYAEFEVGTDLWLAIFPRDEMQAVVDLQPAGDRVVVVFPVENVDHVTESLRGKGVDISQPADRPDWGMRFAHLRDPDGNLIELYHDIEWVRE